MVVPGGQSPTMAGQAISVASSSYFSSFSQFPNNLEPYHKTSHNIDRMALQQDYLYTFTDNHIALNAPIQSKQIQ